VPEQLPEIAAALVDRGYADSDADDMMGGNFLRVATEARGTRHRSGSVAHRATTVGPDHRPHHRGVADLLDRPLEEVRASPVGDLAPPRTDPVTSSTWFT
jgi:hypothetical protein